MSIPRASLATRRTRYARLLAPRSWSDSFNHARRSSARRGVAVVEHQVVAVGVVEEGHVADARVHDLADELDPLGFQLLARRGDVGDVQRRRCVLLRGELHPHPLRLPDAETRVARPELEF